LDFLVPLPLLEASRLISTAEVVTYTLAFAVLAFGKPLHRWSTLEKIGAATAVFVNLHSFPTMAWHTIDGLTLLAVGLVVLDRGLRRERAWQCRTAMVVLGAAVTVKQSFAFAALLGLALIWHHRRNAERPLSLLNAALWSTLLPGLYVAVIAALGGFGPMVTQMSHARPAFGTRMVTNLRGDGLSAIEAVALVALVVVICVRAERLFRGERRDVANTAFCLATSVLVILTPLVTRTSPATPWASELAALLAAVIAWEWLTERRVDCFGLMVLAVGWMVTLSWGYPTPRLVGGTMALTALHRLARRLPVLIAPRRLLTRAMATAMLAAVGATVVHVAVAERRLVPSLNQTGAADDETISRVVPDLGSIRTDQSATLLLRQVTECHHLYPARWTAVLPGPALVYAVMNLNNPFPVDWIYPLEINGSTSRVIDAARKLDAKGNYLVLVQPYLPGASPNPIMDRMVQALTGQRTTCNGLLAIHAPPATA
jgi:hypothetical protein